MWAECSSLILRQVGCADRGTGQGRIPAGKETSRCGKYTRTPARRAVQSHFHTEDTRRWRLRLWHFSASVRAPRILPKMGVHYRLLAQTVAGFRRHEEG